MDFENPNFWKDWWSKIKTDEEILCHLKLPHKAMIKYAERCMHGLTKARVLVPMCGKDVTMKWLVDQGHSVVGIECSPVACEQFFNDHKIKFTSSTKDEFTIYKGVDCEMMLLCGDIFQVTPSLAGGQFDVIFDRGSINSLSRSKAPKYRDMLVPMMAPGCVTLMLYFVPDKDNPPKEEMFDIEFDVVNNAFGSACDIEVVETVSFDTYNAGLEVDEGYVEEVTILTKK